MSNQFKILLSGILVLSIYSGPIFSQDLIISEKISSTQEIIGLDFSIV